MRSLALASLLLAAPALAQQGPTDDAAVPFPAATPLSEGLSPEGVAALDDFVGELVSKGEVVGAELMVIKGGKTVLHSAHGWRDREAEVPMEPGGVFCVRSMTKTLVGIAILRLADDRRIDLDDHASKYLPSFAKPPYDAITVRQLLTHTSGLPMSHLISHLIGKDLSGLGGIAGVAALGPENPLEAAPGERFIYSDQGTDTLTAILEVVSGKEAGAAIQELVLDPLGMTSSATVLTEDHPLRAHASSKYIGSPGNWSRYWKPDDGPLFPYFLGSQGLYSTAEDYARLLDMLSHKGRGPSGRMLKRSTVRRMLRPATDAEVSPTGLPGAKARYGQLAIVWTGPGEDDDEKIVAFGHNGSDGTYAWAFPEQDAYVLYFTQSRGTLSGLAVEERLGDLLLGVPYDPIQAAPPLEQFLGYYREDEADHYRAIIRDGDGLAVEVIGKGIVPLTYIGEDRWRVQPGQVFEFHRDENGVVTGYNVGEHQEFRFTPDQALPSGPEVAARVAAAHRIHELEDDGHIRMTSTVKMEKIGSEGRSVMTIGWPAQWRSDEFIGSARVHVAFDGTASWSASGRPGVEPVATTIEGERAAENAIEGPWVRLGDWREHFDHVETIQLLQNETRRLLLVRCGERDAACRTYWVDMDTWRLVREDKVVHIPEAGRMGMQTVFDDHRDVGGAVIPHRVRTRPANRLVGDVLITLDEVELGVELPEGTYDLGDLRD